MKKTLVFAIMFAFVLGLTAYSNATVIQAVKVSAPTDKTVGRLRRGLKTGRWRDLEEGEK